MGNLAAFSQSNRDIQHIDVGFIRFLKRIHKMPMLSAEEESALTQHYKQFKDAASAQKIVNSHLKLVSRMALAYSGYGLAVNDLVSEGIVGLMKALDKFDPDSGNRFSTYAQWWIRASINEYIIKSWSMVRVGTTASQKKLFFNLRRMKKEMLMDNQDQYLSNENIEEIANELEVKPSEVIEMEQRMNGHDLSLNAPIEDAEGDEWQDIILDDKIGHEEALVESETTRKKRELLELGLSYLDDRERLIIMERRLVDKPKTLEELSSIHNISRERIRQIEVQAFKKMQSSMTRKATESRLVF